MAKFRDRKKVVATSTEQRSTQKDKGNFRERCFWPNPRQDGHSRLRDKKKAKGIAAKTGPVGV